MRQPTVEAGPKIKPNRSAERSAFISGTISQEVLAASGFLTTQGRNRPAPEASYPSLLFLGSFRSAGLPLRGELERQPQCGCRKKRGDTPPRPRGWVKIRSEILGFFGLRIIPPEYFRGPLENILQPPSWVIGRADFNGSLANILFRRCGDSQDGRFVCLLRGSPRAICHTRLSCRCVFVGVSQPRSTNSCVKFEIVFLFRMARGPDRWISRMETVV
jgi:hypothetical protein